MAGAQSKSKRLESGRYGTDVTFAVVQFDQGTPMLKRLTLLWTLVRGDARQLWWALRHPAAPHWLKLGTALIVLYVLSPIDLVPDVIPVLGVVDDLVLVPLAIRWLLKRLPPELAQATASRRAR
jgi:uncharacterized membrane protein YkvA (DUF1232 family)